MAGVELKWAMVVGAFFTLGATWRRRGSGVRRARGGARGGRGAPLRADESRRESGRHGSMGRWRVAQRGRAAADV